MKLYTLLLILLTIVSCTYTRQNQERDRKEAEVVANEYFQNILVGQEDKNISLYSTEFLKAVPKEKIKEQNTFIKEKFGTLQSFELTQWETFIAEGSQNKSEYLLVYKTEYERYPATETLKLEKDEKGKIKIVYYNINSEGLLTK